MSGTQDTIVKPFTVCVLCYADCVTLARRCIESILTRFTPEFCDLRIGVNSPSPEMADYLNTIRDNRGATIVVSHENIGKYPLMRRMFYGDAHLEGVSTSYVMWFDDDSFLTYDAGLASSWTVTVIEKMAQFQLLGSKYQIGLGGNQHLWIESQPWYSGVPISAGCKVMFPRGGWWCASVSFLTAHGYPWSELHHRGGDVMLGQLLTQRGAQWTNYCQGVRINANMAGDDDKGIRRMGNWDPVPIGWRYQP